MRRWHERNVEFGYDEVLDRRLGKPGPKRVPVARVEQVPKLHQERYFDLKVRHFHEKLSEEHQIHRQCPLCDRFKVQRIPSSQNFVIAVI
jgi:hypothetical protein